MPERRQSSYPLLRQFREFYSEMARLRRAAAEGLAVDGDATEAVEASRNKLDSGTAPARSSLPETQTYGAAMAVAEPPETDPEAVHTLQVWQAVAHYLDQKMFDVRHAPSAQSRDLLEELVYIMAAYADETFICLVDWPGASYWRDHLMELRFFRSQISGQVIFSRIDDLLRREDYGAPELCAVYLMVLSLGFKGRYLRHPAAVEAYRRRLYERLVTINPSLRRESARIFPEAYRHTVSEGAPVRLPEPKIWWLVVAGIGCAWLIVSTLVWWAVTGPTRPVLQQTANALAQARSRSVSAAEVKWTAESVEPSDGAFRVELPTNLAMNNGAAGSAGATGNGKKSGLVTLLIAVTGPQGASPGRAEKVKQWLAGGMIVFPAAVGNMNPPSCTVQSVTLANFVPTGITLSEKTELFAVDTGLGGRQLALHPELILPIGGPIGGPDGTAAGTVVLYLPGAAPAGS